MESVIMLRAWRSRLCRLCCWCSGSGAFTMARSAATKLSTALSSIRPCLRGLCSFVVVSSLGTTLAPAPSRVKGHDACKVLQSYHVA